MSKICASCGAELDDSALLCSACGAIGSGTAPIPNASERIGDDIVPLIQYHDYTADTEDNTAINEEEQEADAEASVHANTKKRISHKYIIYACVALILLLILMVLFHQNNNDSDGTVDLKEPNTYKGAIEKYFSAICIGNADKLLDATVPDELIKYYNEQYQSRLNTYAEIADYRLGKLITEFGSDPEITFEILDTHKISDEDISGYKTTLNADAKYRSSDDAIEFDVTEGYSVKMNISVEGYESKIVDKFAEAVVIKANGKWIVEYVFCRECPMMNI